MDLVNETSPGRLRIAINVKLYQLGHATTGSAPWPDRLYLPGSLSLFDALPLGAGDCERDFEFRKIEAAVEQAWSVIDKVAIEAQL
jgi:hypothetical protein